MVAGVTLCRWFLFGGLFSLTFSHWAGELVEDFALHMWMADSLLLKCIAGELEAQVL